ncbi:FusB/FusC family EF-G-binding protein [Halobacillus sp. H74]|uniref:FusB/FusC family EF-G-binding protein n=1 Tax=Halobacillus sp. H74 TaxID=3457436 RepID=UPI003FCE4232
MDAFIRVDQYHFIKDQAHNLLNGHMTTNDSAVTQALKSITYEKVLDLFTELTNEQDQLISQVQQVHDETDAILYFSRLKQYVVPFPELTEDHIKELFPKIKKLIVPSLADIDWSETSYISWNDLGANRKYIVAYIDGKLEGIIGHYHPSRQKSICTICHDYEKVGLFTSTISGRLNEETISRGNYICHDSNKCNQNLKSKINLKKFVRHMQG